MSQSVCAYDAEVRRMVDEPFGYDDWQEGVPVRVTHQSGRIMDLTVYGTMLDNEPVVQLSLECGHEAHLHNDMLSAVARAIGLCCFEVVEFPEYLTTE